MGRFPAAAAPIRVVLFDAFDTLVTPRAAPHLQYAAVAREHGLDVADSDVKAAFKQAFRITATEHPNYGLETDIASPDHWWALVIQRTFIPHLHPAVSEEQYAATIDSLSHRLVTRFGTSQAYRLFEDVVPTLDRLARMRAGDDRPVTLMLATNSDSRILGVLKSFGLDRFLHLDVDGSASAVQFSAGPVLSYFEKCAKPDSRFFQAALQRAATHLGESVPPTNALYVGDQLHEDFWGATTAGLQAAWLQRSTGAESNQPHQQVDRARDDPHDLEHAHQRTITSLADVVDIVESSHTAT
ncbi:predicted hydrolase [Moesziomyces antarcticus T-34]|uniref:Predicted hydrolase n=1 Tax=Pseudozyma antarctica (strain T-34) TaxID=1151754 RepID=M9MG68_PSEA3|nr:predicted hydrolase [Moesziomyces antarcticus T-34]